eukprot:Lithocolla_globosa_v1_NODE_3202_length_1734_cov_5.107207.p1 type:complete len:517 gc:universal NODE_3202_length_1734_cov_5.107207:1645-95(-)
MLQLFESEIYASHEASVVQQAFKHTDLPPRGTHSFLKHSPRTVLVNYRTILGEILTASVPIFPSTTALELVSLTAKKFCQQGQKDEGLLYNDLFLFEVTADGKVTHFKQDETSLAFRLPSHSRFFIEVEINLLKKPSLPIFAPSPRSGQCLFLDIPTVEMTKALCLFDQSLLSKVQPMEYVYKYVKQSTNIETEVTFQNLISFENRFNEVTQWTTTEICLQSSLSKRVLLIEKFIELAENLFSYHNFFSCFAILSGLMNSAIVRLGETWKKVGKSWKTRFLTLQKFLNPRKNMSAYRQLVAQTAPPLIPFLPLILKDIFVILDSNPILSPQNKLIDVSVLQLCWNIISTIDCLRYCKSDWVNSFKDNLFNSSISLSPHPTLPRSSSFSSKSRVPTLLKMKRKSETNLKKSLNRQSSEKDLSFRSGMKISSSEGDNSLSWSSDILPSEKAPLKKSMSFTDKLSLKKRERGEKEKEGEKEETNVNFGISDSTNSYIENLYIIGSATYLIQLSRALEPA